MPRDGEDFHGEDYGGEIEYRSELVHDLPEPGTTGDGGNDDDGGGDDTGGGGGSDSN